MSIINSVLSIVFPRLCLSCSKWGGYFCNTCASNLIHSVQRPICPVCIKQAVGGATHPSCRTKYTIDGLISVFRYKKGVRAGIQKIKYQRQFDIADELVQHTLAIIQKDINNDYVAFDSFIAKNSPILIPIPLHWIKQRKRWFNQSEQYAKHIAKQYNLSVITDILARTKATPSQTQLKKRDRLINIKDAFRVKDRKLCQSTSFLLVDDVWTTGATMREAANTLKRAGADSVWGLTITR